MWNECLWRLLPGQQTLTNCAHEKNVCTDGVLFTVVPNKEPEVPRCQHEYQAYAKVCLKKYSVWGSVFMSPIWFWNGDQLPHGRMCSFDLWQTPTIHAAAEHLSFLIGRSSSSSMHDTTGTYDIPEDRCGLIPTFRIKQECRVTRLHSIPRPG